MIVQHKLQVICCIKMECLIVLVVVSLVSSVLFVKGEEVKDLLPCEFPAIYNFGDSNSDTGGISAAFYPTVLPYGETFFGRAAGRASDGRLIVDFIAEYLLLPYLSPYLDSIGANFLHGANFATGGSTIRQPNQTVFVSNRSPFYLDIQIVQFRQFKARISDLYKQGRRDLPSPENFSNALYIIDIGQNDLGDDLQTKSYAQIPASIQNMIDQLALAIQYLYDEGARAFWIHNTGPIGCSPYTLTYIHNPEPGYLDQHGCIKDQNDMAKEFNNQLKDRLIKLRAKLPDAALTYVDVYAAKYGLISDAMKQGFVDPRKICCGYIENETRVWCGRHEIINGTEIYGSPCINPSAFVSWDGVHYTDAANRWIADSILNGSLSDPPIPITQACHKPEQ